MERKHPTSSRTTHRTATRLITSPADLLAVIPGLIGFHPQESVVVVTVGPAHQPFHARVDLPEDPVAIEDVTHYLAGVAGRHGLTRVAAVVYSQDAGLTAALGRELADRLADRDVDLVVLLRADGERWWALHAGPGDPDEPGTPYDVSTHPLMAQTVVDGTVVHRSRRELADSLVGTDPDEAEQVGVLADELVRGLARSAGGGRAGRAPLRARLVLEGRWVQQRVCRFLQDGQPLDVPDLARLATLVAASGEVRDVAWSELRHDSSERLVVLWRDVVRRVPVDLRAGPATLLGFAAWVSGAGALAWCAVDVALEADPGNSLATVLGDTLSTAVPPSAWRPFSAADLTLFAG